MKDQASVTRPRTYTAEREEQIFNYTYLTKHNMWEVKAELDAERSAHQQTIQQQWRPIETAPKDGTAVLLGKAGFPVGIYSYRSVADSSVGAQWYQGFSGNAWWILNPTHWMPLPDPPEAKDELMRRNLAKGVCNYSRSGRNIEAVQNESDLVRQIENLSVRAVDLIRHLQKSIPTSSEYTVDMCPKCGKALPSPWVIHSVGFACECGVGPENGAASAPTSSVEANALAQTIQAAEKLAEALEALSVWKSHCWCGNIEDHTSACQKARAALAQWEAVRRGK